VNLTTLTPFSKTLGETSSASPALPNPYPKDILGFQVFEDRGSLRLSVDIVPFRFNPDTGEVTLHDKVDYKVTYEAPTTYAAQDIIVNDSKPVNTNQKPLPFTVNFTAQNAFAGTMSWEFNGADGLLLGAGQEALNLGAGAAGIDVITDALGWPPGPVQLLVSFSTAPDGNSTSTTVATGQTSFTAVGRSIDVEVDRITGKTASDAFTFTAVVRDETGAEVAGLADSLTTHLNGESLNLTWTEGGSYTATLTASGLGP
jgi:hypothetical protein